MRTSIIITLLLALCMSHINAQSNESSSNQTRTIEIDNDKGELIISFKNKVITKFEINDRPVPENRYDDYQEIIDDFAGEEVAPTPPAPPAPPASPSGDSADLYALMVDYLEANHGLNPEKRFKIKMKKDFLKLNGKELSNDTHQACLDFFEEIYGHSLNQKSQVKFKHSRGGFSSSVSINK